MNRQEEARMVIDQQEYSAIGQVDCVHGSGDNKEEWSFQALRGPGGETVLFNQDKGKSSLYLLPKQSLARLEISETFETCPVDTVRGGKWGKFQYNNTEIRWVGLKGSLEDMPGPFARTDQAMLINEDTYPCVPLMELDKDEFYSARFPARKQLQPTVAAHRPDTAARVVEGVVALLLLSLLVWGVVTGSLTSLSLYWWGSLVAALLFWFTTPGDFHYDGLRLWTGAFFLFFSTHFLDTMIVGEQWDLPASFKFEALHAALIVAGLYFLRHAWLRGYCILADAGRIGGGCSCLVFGSGLAFWSMLEEFSYFPFYRWYSGASPWGYLWLLVLCFMVYDRFQDYRQAPLIFEEFVYQLNRLHRIVSSGIEATVAHQDELVRVCDDLEDAVRMSLDHRVTSLLHLGPSFLKLKASWSSLSSLGELSAEDRQLVEEDLATVAQDLRAVLDQVDKWGEGAELKRLRVSSFLMTYND